MDFHLFVASCVYAVAIMAGIIFITDVLPEKLSDPRTKAKIKRFTRKILRRMLRMETR